MQIVAYEHKLPITKVLKLLLQNIQGSEIHSVEKGDFFSFTSQSPDYEEMGLFSESAARPFVTYLRRGDRKQLPALNQNEALSPCEVQQTHVDGKTVQFHVLNNSVNSWMVFWTGLQIIDINIVEKTEQIL